MDEQKQINVIYLEEKKTIPKPNSFIELKYYICESFKRYFDFNTFKIEAKIENDDDEIKREFLDNKNFEEKMNSDELEGIYIHQESAVVEKPKLENEIKNEEIIKEIKDSLDKEYKKKFEELKNKINQHLGNKLNQALKEIISFLNQNKNNENK